MNNEIIDAARKRFDSQLHTTEYRKIHSDDVQLDRLINVMEIIPGKSYLDIGTGNGYVAFQLAKRFPDIFVHGLDIASHSIQQNIEIKLQENISNIDFIVYDGINFPYSNNIFYGAVSRYAFHHFPNIEKSIYGIKNLLQTDGFFILSDPLTYEEDNDSFVDQFQKLKHDGHVHFYRRKEIERYFEKYDFQIEEEFESTIRYPRRMDENYEKLLKITEKNILDKYKIEVESDLVYITVTVMNIFFRKKANN